jgi:hypothetical protein
VQDRLGGRLHAAQRHDRAQPQPLQRGQLQPPDVVGQMGERVGARVALVQVRIRQRPDAAGIKNDHRRTTHCRPIMSMAEADRARSAEPSACDTAAPYW